MTDIRIHEESVIFHKALYHESELLLAKCYNFDINLETGEITAPLRFTSKQALFYFIELAFKNFWESPLQEDRKSNFLKQVDEIYAVYENHVSVTMGNKLPYSEKFKKHQIEATNFSFFNKNTFLALEMRLGKSIVSASLSRLLNIRKTVIICPASVKWSWFRQLTAEWGFNELYFTILDASKSKNIIAFQERFVIINYDVLGNFYNHLVQTPIGHFIIDESHRLKNHQTARFKNTKKLVDMFPDAKITLLSGTPIKNRVNDIFAYLKLTGHPLGSNHKRFLDEYAISTTSRGAQRVTGGKNLVDLRKKLANFMLIKTQDECLDLPKKMFLSYRYSLDDYREKYNAIIEELSQQKDISSLTGNLHSLNILTSLAKIKGIIEIAEDIIENGQKVVIFGSYKDPLNELEQYFGERCVKIDGSVPSQKRDTLVQRFTNDEKCEVFLGNMQAAGEGINLAVASNVIFINFPLTPDEIMQPLNRCENMNRKGILTICYTFCDESIDEYLYELIEDKQNEINTFTGKENLNIHRHNTVEHLVSKLLKRDISAEEEVATHSLEGGEDVTMKDNFVNHMMSVKQVVIPDVNPDAHIMPDFSKPVIDIPDFDVFEKEAKAMLEENKDVVDKSVEDLVLFGKAEMRYVDPPETAEPVTERLTLEELFRRYPATPLTNTEDSVKGMPFGSEEVSKLMTETFESIPSQSKDAIPNKPASDFDLPEFLT